MVQLRYDDKTKKRLVKRVGKGQQSQSAYNPQKRMPLVVRKPVASVPSSPVKPQASAKAWPSSKPQTPRKGDTPAGTVVTAGGGPWKWFWLSDKGSWV